MKITAGIDKRIQKTFTWGKENGVNFLDPGHQHAATKKVSTSTLNSYANVVKTYNKWLQDTHGISIDRAKPRHTYQYVEQITEQVKKGVSSAWTLKSIPHAVHAFQVLSGKSGAFKRECRVGDKRLMMKHINDEGIERKYTESHSLKATSDEYDKVKEKMANSSSMYKSYAMAIHESQRQLGLRVHESVKMQVRDINFLDKTVRVVGKGGLERYVKITDFYLKDLKKQCEGKKGGADVFQIQNRKGDPPSRVQRQKIIKNEVRKAADAASIGRDGKVYTTHSARKAYAQARVDELKRLKGKTIEKLFANHCTQDNLFKNKADKALENIRKKIKNVARSKNRRLTKREMVMFIVSCEIGHFRLDVMRYYVEY